MENLWELRSRIEKIIELNVKEVSYEGTDVNKRQLLEDIMELIPRIPTKLIDKLRTINQ